MIHMLTVDHDVQSATIRPYTNSIIESFNTTSNNSSLIYTLIVRNRVPNIRAGDTLEIEVFISGYGIPLKNKMNVFWSSPYVIDSDNTGYVKFINQEPVNLDPSCVIIGFPIDFFSSNITTKEDSESRFPLKIGEAVINNEIPLLFIINTAKTAPSGDYEVTFIFTYGDEQNIYQDYKTIKFHVNSWWEMNQTWITIIAIVIAFFSLVTALIVGIWNLKINRSRK